MAPRKENRKKVPRKKQRSFISERYTKQSLHEDRQYGLFWYEWLWKAIRPVLIVFCALLIVIGVVASTTMKLYETFLGPVDALSANVVEFVIPEGSSVRAIGSQLEEEGLMRYGKLFQYLIQFQGLTENLSYGTYRLSPSMSVMEIVAQLTSTDATGRERVITIVPGWTCENIADYLQQEGIIVSREEFLSLCNDTDLFAGASYALTAAQKEGRLGQRKYALEGYLAPDTYRIFSNASLESIIGTLLNQHNTLIDDVYYADYTHYVASEDGSFEEVKAYSGNLSMDEIVTLASIVEKEAASAEDYRRVAAVFFNRLKLGWKLESDPTATYLTGANHLVLTEEELNADNAYNTYRITGLPAGPICNPSRKALEAVLDPDLDYIRDGYMYFCTGEPGTGTLLFARTLEEHTANVERYRERWTDYDLSNGAAVD